MGGGWITAWFSRRVVRAFLNLVPTEASLSNSIRAEMSITGRVPGDGVGGSGVGGPRAR